MNDPGQPASASPDSASASVPPVIRDLVIVNKRGLHARASAKFVQLVEQYEADVKVSRGGETVGGTSIMGLMMLSAAPGTTIHIEASGRQAAEVVDGLAALIENGFGEED